MINFIYYHKLIDHTDRIRLNILFINENYVLELDKGLLVLDLKNHKNIIASSYPSSSKPIINDLDTDQLIICNIIETKVLYSEHPFFKDKQDVIFGQAEYTNFDKSLCHTKDDEFITQFVCSKAEFYGGYKPWSLRTIKKLRKILNFNIRERNKNYADIQKVDDFTLLFRVLFYKNTLSIKFNDPRIWPPLNWIFHINIRSIREIYFSSNKSIMILKIQKDFIICIDNDSGMQFRPDNDIYLEFRKEGSVSIVLNNDENSFDTYMNNNNLFQVYPNIYEKMIHESKYPEYSDLYFEKVKTMEE